MILLEKLRNKIEEAIRLGIEDSGALQWVLEQIDNIEDAELQEMADAKSTRN